MNGIGEAGIAKAQVTLPRSEFIAQCPLQHDLHPGAVQAGAAPGEKCPAGSIYGKAMAETPILDEPLTGPVFLRSSEHQLPDVVAALHNGQIDVVLVGRVDSVKGSLRNTFESTPTPRSRSRLQLHGRQEGPVRKLHQPLQGTHKAIAAFTGQNGKQLDFNPVVKATGCKAKAKKQKRRAKQSAQLAPDHG